MFKQSLVAEIVNHQQSGILVINSDFKICFVNRWFLDKSGMNDCIIGEDFTYTFPEIANSRLLSAAKEVIEIQLPALLSHTFNPSPFPLFNQFISIDDRSRIQQLIKITPLKDSDENYCVIYIQDFSASIAREKVLRNQQTEVRKSMLEANKANEIKSQFLANMSHEIRTPLNGMIGASSLLSLSNLDVEQRELVSTLRTCGENLLALINDILDLSKIESGELELEHAPFNLLVCIEDAFDLFSGAEGRNNIDLFYHLNAVPEHVIGDVTRLRQVIVNFISNAIKFTANGQVSLEVRKTNRTKEGLSLLFIIKDDGIGIAEDKIAGLFNPFTQADVSTTKNFGGTGLGLSICRSLVAAMGGECKVASVVGQGSTFSFIVNLKEDKNKVSDDELIDFQNKKVVLLEKNQQYRDILINHLSEMNLNVISLSDSKTLYQTISTTSPDIVLADLNIENKFDVDLIRKLNTDNSDIRLILLSTSFIDSDNMDDIHFSDFLVKPIKKVRMISLLKNKLLQDSNITSEVVNQTELKLADVLPAKILVAEDNTTNQIIMIKMLDKLGYYADLASDGEEAVTRVLEKQYDIVFMDIQMPKIDGFEATKQIRTNLKNHKQPWVIALTANTLEVDKNKSEQSGMNDFLAKPLSFADLRIKLKSTLEKFVDVQL